LTLFVTPSNDKSGSLDTKDLHNYFNTLGCVNYRHVQMRFIPLAVAGLCLQCGSVGDALLNITIPLLNPVLKETLK